MAKVIWTEPALQELDEIADYISLDNPTAAKKLIQKVFDRIDLLHEHPISGKPVIEIKPSVYREVVVPPCRIFYRIDKKALYIIHVIREEKLLRLNKLRSR